MKIVSLRQVLDDLGQEDFAVIGKHLVTAFFDYVENEKNKSYHRGMCDGVRMYSKRDEDQ